MSPTQIRLWCYGILLFGVAGYGAYATWMPGTSFSGDAKELSPDERALSQRLRNHVEVLAHDIGPRNIERPEKLREARDYLRIELALIGTSRALAPKLEELDRAAEGAQNLLFEIPGTSGREVVVVGAHYDSCFESPGANDNGSGVAVALELARAFALRPAKNIVRVVFFANEEPPFFQRPGMGSRANAAYAKRRGDKIRGMVALETMGYYSDAVGSQRYPWPVGLLYPSTANFIAFVGDLGSRDLVHRAIRTFRATTDFPSEGAALPSTFPGVDWSDHWSFRQEGYPALMVTDTAVYRDPNYHEPSDTPEKLDYPRLAKVANGVEAVLRELAR